MRRTTLARNIPSAATPYLRELVAHPQQHVDAVRTRVFAAYGYPEPGTRLDPLSSLIATILSQHTSNTNSHRAFQLLRDRFATWSDVATANVEEVADAIRPGGLAAQKAPRIQQALRSVRERFGDYDLSILEQMPRDEARTLLMSLAPGIGPKTASCVLLFSLGLPAFCVDTHIQRICARVGLIAPRDGPLKAQHLLEATVPPDDTYALHVALIQHGRQVCRAMRPQCPGCPLVEVCLYGASATASRA